MRRNQLPSLVCPAAALAILSQSSCKAVHAPLAVANDNITVVATPVPGGAPSDLTVRITNTSTRTLVVCLPRPAVSIQLRPGSKGLAPSPRGEVLFSVGYGDLAVIPPGRFVERTVPVRELVDVTDSSEGEYVCRLIYFESYVNGSLESPAEMLKRDPEDARYWRAELQAHPKLTKADAGTAYSNQFRVSILGGSVRALF